MNKRYIIGLYGQVGTGKSTVSTYFQKKNWEYINQDILGHQVIVEYPKELIQLFGENICSESRIVDRKKLGNIVFSSPDKLSQLVDFSYPIIIQKTLDLLQKYSNHIIIEGAIFYKIREFIPYTHLIYIEVQTDLLYQRLIQRGHSPQWIDNVLLSQKDIVMHKNIADFLLTNNQDISYLHHQIDLILTSLLS